nr:ABC transporter permease [uncultured Acetatifactor sp.]
MEKILRLSFANIKKHKKQTILLTLLIVFCMAVTSAAAAGSIDMTGLFPRVADEYAVHKNALYIKEDYYNDSFIRLLREDERVTDIDHVRVLFSTATKYLDKEGEEQALYMSFVTKELEKNIERSPIETTLTDEEIAALEHPIYLPYAGQESLASKLSEGDTFNIIYGTKLFSFTVAGFYESIFMPTTGMGFQMIVSDSDYVSLMTIIGKYEMVLFDCNPLDDCVDIYLKFYDRVEEQTGKDIGYNILSLLYKNLEQKSAVFSEIVIGIMLFMAVVIFIAAAIMIRFRIAGDIQDQIQSIGVLEALGYTSKEIALSYTAEYLMTALAGVIIGAGGAFALLPVLHRVAETLSGHHGSLHISPLPILLTALIILIFVGVIAHTRALAVKKYPPVRAFRKGIAVHHFGKNRFPLRNTKNSVHLRLALKGFFDNMKQNISLTVCIAVSALAAVAGILIADLFASDLKAAAWLTGEEMPDQIVTVMHSVNTEELAERISEMQGVKRVQTGSFSLDLSEWRSLYAFDRESCLVPVSYPDFSQCENIQATAGRLPEHDNEIAVSKLFATQHSLKVGDNLTLECNRVKKNYIICGLIPSMSNDGTTLYITEQALKRIMPTYRPSAIEIYLEDKTDRAEFQTLLMQIERRKFRRSNDADRIAHDLRSCGKGHNSHF